MAFDRREVVSLEIPVGLATVWEHLREPNLVRRWFAWERPRLDHEIEEFVSSATSRLDVVHDATTHTLTWPNHDTLSVTAAAHEPHVTRLRVTRRSHDLLADRFDGNMDEVDEDWIANTHQLRFALSRQLGHERRTLSLVEADAGPRNDRLLDRAGMHGAHGVPVHGHLQVRRPDGSLLGGTVLYRTEHQVGVALLGIEGALLVVRETPIGTRPPHGTVTAVMSVFGLDQSEFDEIAAHWSAWWSAVGAPVPTS